MLALERKFRGEEWRERSFNGCLVGKGSGKNVVGPKCFLLKPTKKFSPQNGEKTKGGRSLTRVIQNALARSSLLTFFVSLLLIYAHSRCLDFFILAHFFF